MFNQKIWKFFDLLSSVNIHFVNSRSFTHTIIVEPKGCKPDSKPREIEPSDKSS